MPLTPSVKWAQRSNAEDETKNIIFLTIEVFNAKDINIDLTSTSLKFDAKAQDSDDKYELAIDFFDEIDPEKSQKNVGSGKHVYFVLRKKNKQEEYWPRLTKEKVKYKNIKTDFDKWVDEDEQDEQAEEEDPMAGMGGMPGMPGMEGMGGMPGMGGAGGMDFASMMQGLGGGAGGAGGAGDFDISKLAAQLGGAGGMPDLSALGGDQEGEEGEGEGEGKEAAEQK